MKNLCLSALLVFGSGIASPATAEKPQKPGVTSEVLIESASTILGQPFYYPNGTARMTALVVTIPPGAEIPSHFHSVPVLGYILKGELTVDYGEGVTKTYRRGEALIEAFQHVHNGRNGGRGKTEVLVVYAGAVGVENTTPVDPD